MVNIDPGRAATAALELALHSGGDVLFRVDVGAWTGEQVRLLVDEIVKNAAKYSTRLKGIRADGTSFAKFGIDRDTSNSGRYGKVPVVHTDIDFDTVEIVLAHLPK